MAQIAKPLQPELRRSVSIRACGGQAVAAKQRRKVEEKFRGLLHQTSNF
jgi:hypothetical protein